MVSQADKDRFIKAYQKRKIKKAKKADEDFISYKDARSYDAKRRSHLTKWR